MVVLILLLLVLPLVTEARPKDRQPPTVTIQQPTTASTYVTTQTQLTVAGSARDNVQVTQVRWQTDRGSSGIATGTTAWSCALTLASGTTRVTVTAFDATGRSGSDTLTITLMDPPPALISHELAWDYAAIASQFRVYQCTNTVSGCAMQVVTVLPGTARTVILDGFDPAHRYCWQVGETGTGTLSNIVCTG